MSRKKIVWYTKETYSRWSDHHAARLGASVAFYSILSSAPLLLLVTALVALIFGHENAQRTLIYHARQLVGTHGAETANTLLKNAQKPSSGIFSTVVAFITLLFGASGVFMELQDALNIMWDAPKQTTSGLKAMLKERLFSFGMVLSVGFLLLISLIMSTVFAYLGRGFGALVPLSPPVLQGINSLVSFGVIAFLFALMFKYVPNVKIAFRDVVIGAIGTALLFAIGKILLGIYLGKASVGSTYGAAGSVVAVVVWIYYSAQIFFFGAEFTRVYADANKGTIIPKRTGEEAATNPPPLREAPQEVAGPAKPALSPALHPSARVISTPALPLQTGATVKMAVPLLRNSTNYGLLALLVFGFLAGRASTARHQKRTSRL